MNGPKNLSTCACAFKKILPSRVYGIFLFLCCSYFSEIPIENLVCKYLIIYLFNLPIKIIFIHLEK